MAKNNETLTGMFDSLSPLVRILILIIGGVIVGGIYRIAKWFETKNTLTLVVGLLATFTGIGNIIIWWVDVITTIVNGKITVFAD